MSGSDFTLNQTLAAFGLEITQTNREQLSVMMEAMRIFQVRNKVHGNLWAEQDVEDAAHHVRSKAARLYNVATRLSPGELDMDEWTVIKDSALDGINYNVFAIRHVRGLKG